MSARATQITSLTIVYSIVYSGAYQRKHQSSASLAFVRGIHRWPGNSPHKGPVKRKMFPFDDIIMQQFYPRQFQRLSSSLALVADLSTFLEHNVLIVMCTHTSVQKK